MQAVFTEFEFSGDFVRLPNFKMHSPTGHVFVHAFIAFHFITSLSRPFSA
jgi:hypothetical protein